MEGDSKENSEELENEPKESKRETKESDKKEIKSVRKPKFIERIKKVAKKLLPVVIATVLLITGAHGIGTKKNVNKQPINKPTIESPTETPTSSIDESIEQPTTAPSKDPNESLEDIKETEGLDLTGEQNLTDDQNPEEKEDYDDEYDYEIEQGMSTNGIEYGYISAEAAARGEKSERKHLNQEYLGEVTVGQKYIINNTKVYEIHNDNGLHEGIICFQNEKELKNILNKDLKTNTRR